MEARERNRIRDLIADLDKQKPLTPKQKALRHRLHQQLWSMERREAASEAASLDREFSARLRAE